MCCWLRCCDSPDPPISTGASRSHSTWRAQQTTDSEGGARSCSGSAPYLTTPAHRGELDSISEGGARSFRAQRPTRPSHPIAVGESRLKKRPLQSESSLVRFEFELTCRNFWIRCWLWSCACCSKQARTRRYSPVIVGTASIFTLEVLCQTSFDWSVVPCK
jgi:hypothetical protein